MPVFKKPKRRKGARKKKRKSRNDSDDDDPTTIVHKKARTSKTNTFSTKAAAKDDDLLNPHMIKSKRDAAPVKYAGDATYTQSVDTATDRDARALLEKKIAMANAAEEEGAVGPDGVKVYRGQQAYSTFMKTSAEKVGKNKVTGTLGPLRAPSNLRNTCRFDYQPDLCKDFKDTGYCGFGDTCKFMHDRGDYKAGWQIEKEWEEAQKKKRMGMDSDDDDDKYVIHSDDEDMPFACHLCRDDFKNPIRTNCGHYFCLGCAMKRFKKTSTCAVCGKDTEGVFNNAPKLLAKLKERDGGAASGAEDGDADDSSGGGIVGELGSDEEGQNATAAALARKAAQATAAAPDDDGADVGGWEVVESD